MTPFEIASKIIRLHDLKAEIAALLMNIKWYNGKKDKERFEPELAADCLKYAQTTYEISQIESEIKTYWEVNKPIN